MNTNFNNSQGKYPEADQAVLETFVRTHNVHGVIAVATGNLLKKTGKNSNLNYEDSKVLENITSLWLKRKQIVEPRNMSVYNYFSNPEESVAIVGAVAEVINDVYLKEAKRNTQDRVKDIF